MRAKNNQEIVSFCLPPEVRLDHYLVNFLNTKYTRSQIQKKIAEGLVTLENEPATKSGFKVKAPTNGKITLIEEMPAEIKPVDLSIKIIYQDDYFAIVHKPAGITVHPGIGTHNDTLVHGLLAKVPNLAPGFGPDRPGLVHRLDRETEGLMLVAKTKKAHAHLANQFKDRTVKKIYFATIWGAPRVPKSRLVGWIMRHEKHRKRMKFTQDADAEYFIKNPLNNDPSRQMNFTKPFKNAHQILAELDSQDMRAADDPPLVIPKSKGKAAALRYRILATKGDFSQAIVILETGRTHQIRATFASIGHPIVGDHLYSEEKRLIKRFHLGKRKVAALPALGLGLLAKRLHFKHPQDSHPINFSIPVSTRFWDFWEKI